MSANGDSHLDAATLVEVAAALAGGASPAAALAAGARAGGALEPAARASAVGRPLQEIAAEIRTGDAAADLLVRALALAERSGGGGAAAVTQAVEAARGHEAVARALRSKSTQARGTAKLLAVLPLALWGLLALLEPAVLAWPLHPLGMVTTVLAIILNAAGFVAARALLRRCEAAPLRVDPLHHQRTGLSPRRIAAGAAVCGVALMVAGPGLGLVLLALGVPAAVAWTRRSTTADGVDTRTLTGGGAAETVELVAVALAAGMAPRSAVEAVAGLVPPAAEAAVGVARRRLQAGFGPDAAFAGTGLDDLGRVLAATTRWGAPAAPALRALGADLRATRRSAAETAAEHAQLALVFPTTLLTLPAFVLAIVPPLLWSAFQAAAVSFGPT